MHRLLLSACVATFLAACSGGGDDDDQLTDSGQDARVGQMRFVNAIPDSPVIEMLHDARNSARFVELLNFGASSNRNDFVIGDFEFNFGYVNGAGQRITLFEDAAFPLRDGQEFSWIMIGTLNNARVLRVDNPEFLLGLDDATADVAPQIQYVHTAVGVGEIDFYLTDNGADIGTATPQATLAFGEHSALFDIEATTTAQLRAYAAGSTTELLFDSGATTFARTTRSMILAANYFGPTTGSQTSVELLRLGRTPEALSNANQPSTLRVHNVVTDENAIDVYLGDATGTPEFSNLAFADRSAELQLAAQVTDITVTAAGNPQAVILELSDSVLAAAQRQTLYVGGVGSDPDNNNEPDIGSALAPESSRAISEGVPLRVFNGSSSTGAVAIFVLRPGQTVADTASTNLTMGGYASLSVITGDFDLVINETANNSTIYGPERVTPTPGTALNIVIRDTFGGTSPVVVDFVEDTTTGLN